MRFAGWAAIPFAFTPLKFQAGLKKPFAAVSPAIPASWIAAKVTVYRCFIPMPYGIVSVDYGFVFLM
jgi:hypothetical protein